MWMMLGYWQWLVDFYIDGPVKAGMGWEWCGLQLSDLLVEWDRVQMEYW